MSTRPQLANNHMAPGVASMNNHIPPGPHTVNNNFSGPPINNHAHSIPPMTQAASRMQQSTQMKNARPPTVPPGYQYNQKASQYSQSQYPMSQANGISNDPVGMSGMPPSMHGPGYPQSHYPQHQPQQTQSHMRLDPDNIPNPVRSETFLMLSPLTDLVTDAYMHVSDSSNARRSGNARKSSVRYKSAWSAASPREYIVYCRR